MPGNGHLFRAVLSAIAFSSFSSCSLCRQMSQIFLGMGPSGRLGKEKHYFMKLEGTAHYAHYAHYAPFLLLLDFLDFWVVLPRQTTSFKEPIGLSTNEWTKGRKADL
jgi:hypothetical protein